MSNIVRELATVRRIDEIKSIPERDLICAYRVDGWWVVDQINRYAVGDLVVFFEVDSMIPHALAPFLAKGGKEKAAYRLKTIRLGGQISQGLLMPVADVLDPEFRVEYFDATSLLGIVKYEPQIESGSGIRQGQSRGNFPSFIPKTDQQRIQNCKREYDNYVANHVFEVTEKLHGQSMTVYYLRETPEREAVIGVCSRNMDIKESDDSALWKAAKQQGLINAIKLIAENSEFDMALQGELCGPGINGNNYGFHEPTFFLFDIFNITDQHYVVSEDRIKLALITGIRHVPIRTNEAWLDDNVRDVIEAVNNMESLISMTDKKLAEGLVFKSVIDPSVSFKVISENWLLENQ